jgi:hypothetical protein
LRDQRNTVGYARTFFFRMMPISPQRSLKHEYEIYVREEIEHYKDSVPRTTLLSIGDEAVSSLREQAQLPLTEMLLCEEVDRIISRRLRIPAYTTWKRRRTRLADRFRTPEHWNLSPDDALVRVMQRTTEGHVLVASPPAEGHALYLAANGCEVTAVDSEPDLVRRVLSAAGAAGLSMRGCVANLDEWAPDVSLSAVVCGPSAFANLTLRERRRVIEILQSATRDGGVHLVETIAAGDNTLTFEELRSQYRGWQVNMDQGALGSSPAFIARKLTS